MTNRSNVPATVPQSEPADLPALIRDAGGAARFAFEEFLHGQIRNPFTRKAYLLAIRLSSDWCVARGLELVRVTPADVGRFLDFLPVALPTRELHLAALRRFFDGLGMRHLLILNPPFLGHRNQPLLVLLLSLPLDVEFLLLASEV